MNERKREGKKYREANEERAAHFGHMVALGGGDPCNYTECAFYGEKARVRTVHRQSRVNLYLDPGATLGTVLVPFWHHFDTPKLVLHRHLNDIEDLSSNSSLLFKRE